MQNNSTKPRKIVESVSLDWETGEWLRLYAFNHRIKKQQVLRQALAEFREREDKKQEPPSTKTPAPSKQPPRRR